MYTKEQLLQQIREMGIQPTDTLLVHSSMKSIGQVEGGADTVLDALSEAVHDGLLVLPTHTWAQINEKNSTYDPETEPSCVGVLTNLFRVRPGVVRSLHPTHSVAALGKDAVDYVSGEEFSDTPCPRTGCWGKLYDRRAKVLFLGCSLKRNTYLHGVEEWNNTPDRLTEGYEALRIVTPGGVIDRPMHRHHTSTGDVSHNYDKMQPAFVAKGIAVEGCLGDAQCFLCDAVGMADLTSEYLRRNPALFVDETPVPEEWYK